MRHAPALFVCALFVAAWCYAFTIQPEPTFTYLAFDAQGDAYALDTGLTYEDCEAAARTLPDHFEAAYCEAEG
jgi:hypothetical protein